MQLYYPPANRTAQWFQDTQHDAAFTGGLEKVVWHTTEGSGWPGYAGGAKAPHWTVLPDMSARTVAWRQHFPANVYSRALKNEPGGVQTNLDNCLQVEIVGTCDPVAHRAHPSWLFTPQAPDWFLAELAGFARYALDNWGIPLTAPAFHAFPGSAGATNKHRFSGPTWNAFRGHCGHQHVPENCVVPETPVLTANLDWVPAGDLSTGDALVSFDEEPVRIGSATGGRRFREALATVHGRVLKDCWRVTLEDGRSVVASADHRWLVNLPYVNHGSRIRWIASAELDPRLHQIKSIGRPWRRDDSRPAGYLAGCIDCDGYLYASTEPGRYDSAGGFGQSDQYAAVLDKFVGLLRDRGLRFTTHRRDQSGGYASSGAFTDLRVRGGLWENIAALATIGPEKFEKWITERIWAGATIGKTTRPVGIASVEHVGPMEVVSLESSAATYVANGLLCHNTHGDPGALPMDRVLTLAQETDMALTTTEIDAIAVAAATETWTRFSIHTPEGDLASLQETLGRTLRASETPPPVDAQALAAALAPLLAPLVPSLTDEDLDRVAAVVADEQARRLAS